MSFDKIIEVDGKVKVISETRPNVAYHLTRVNNNCDQCQMTCNECGVCAHEFHCTCTDFLLKSNICKHIHLFKRYESGERVKIL